MVEQHVGGYQPTQGYQSTSGAPPSYTESCQEKRNNSGVTNNGKSVELNGHDYQVQQREQAKSDAENCCVSCGVGALFGTCLGGVAGAVAGGVTTSSVVGATIYCIVGGVYGGCFGVPLGCAVYGVYSVVKGCYNKCETSKYQKVNV